MKTNNKKNSAIKVIAYCIENDEKGIRKLLLRNGVDTTAVRSKSNLTKVFMDALSKSKALAVEFIAYVRSKNKSFNFTGETRPPLTSVSAIEPYGIVENPISTTQTNSSATDKNGTGFFSGLNLADLINTTVGIMQIQKEIEISKNNREAVTQAVQVERDKIKLKPDEPTSSNTALYVVLGVVGVATIGTLIYFIAKK